MAAPTLSGHPDSQEKVGVQVVRLRVYAGVGYGHDDWLSPT